MARGNARVWLTLAALVGFVALLMTTELTEIEDESSLGGALLYDGRGGIDLARASESKPAGAASDPSRAFTEDGRFRPRPWVRHVYEAFLVTADDETLPRQRTRLAEHLQDRLPPRAAEEALEVADRFYEYLREVRGAKYALMGATEREVEVNRLRDEVLGRELADGLFADDPARSAARVVAGESAVVRSAFERRYEAYRSELDILLELTPEMAGDEATLSALRNQHFGPHELERVTERDREASL